MVWPVAVCGAIAHSADTTRRRAQITVSLIAVAVITRPTIGHRWRQIAVPERIWKSAQSWRQVAPGGGRWRPRHPARAAAMTATAMMSRLFGLKRDSSPCEQGLPYGSRETLPTSGLGAPNSRP